ncbi:hypothetical protein L665_02792 [Ralstonia solanacearum SD54]|nr:hypothetical protein L665_02792 [Ralstonia solanacearum SD54]
MIEFHGRQGGIGTVVWQNPAALPVSAGRRIHASQPASSEAVGERSVMQSRPEAKHASDYRRLQPPRQCAPPDLTAKHTPSPA